MASVARERTGMAPGSNRTTADRYRSVRTLSTQLVAPLTAEDMVIQAMPDVSPPKWHLAHTAWFFETFVLAPQAPGYRVFDPRFGFLFNSYYNQIGTFHARARRGLLSRPTTAEVLAYRAHVDAALADFADAPRDLVGDGTRRLDPRAGRQLDGFPPQRCITAFGLQIFGVPLPYNSNIQIGRHSRHLRHRIATWPRIGHWINAYRHRIHRHLLDWHICLTAHPRDECEHRA